jgi:branched-chain amino acid transport system substrate-binding protein
MKAITFQSAALAALMMAGPAFAADQGVTDTEILLGEVEPLTGPPALLGVAHNLGVRLAIEETNADGGVAGRKLRLIAEDDGYVTARTIQAIKKLTSVDKVFALTALSGSGQALASMPVIEQIGIPTMSPIGTVPALYDPPKDNLFVVGQTYVEGMHQLALFLADKFPGKKWGIVLQDDDYGLQLQEGIDMAREEKDIDIVYESRYKRGQKDFSSEMLGVKDAGVEVFIAGGIISENIAMVKEMEKLGIDPATAIFWPGRVSAVLKLIGPASDGLYAVDYVTPMASDEGKAFMELAKEHLSEEELARINRYTLTGYSSTRALIEAIKRCADDLTWACTNAELAKTKGLETGVMETISFDGSRFSNQPVQIMQADFENLTFKPVE